MSWQDDAMIEQDMADALWDMGEAEWRELMHEHHGWQRKEKEDEDTGDIRTRKKD